MAGKRTKPIHSLLQKIMKRDKISDLQTLAKAKGIDERYIYVLADGKADKNVLRKHWETAQALGLSLDEYAQQWLQA